MDDFFDLVDEEGASRRGASYGPGSSQRHNLASGDINDLFDSCAFLEDSHFEQGKAAGERSAINAFQVYVQLCKARPSLEQILPFVNHRWVTEALKRTSLHRIVPRKAAEQAASYGRRLGVEKGFNLAQEVGFIGGVCSAWQQIDAKQPGSIPPRALKAIEKLFQLVADFPLADPNDESIEDKLEDLRGKFKAVVSRLGQTQTFYPRGKTPMQLAGCVDAVVDLEELMEASAPGSSSSGITTTTGAGASGNDGRQRKAAAVVDDGRGGRTTSEGKQIKGEEQQFEENKEAPAPRLTTIVDF